MPAGTGNADGEHEKSEEKKTAQEAAVFGVLLLKE
jgi:hypothetical protein